LSRIKLGGRAESALKFAAKARYVKGEITEEFEETKKHPS
jgi:hypothetical protein